MSDYIPFEIQSEILKRIPTKSLMRFRMVSKPYKSLIDSSEFINDYSFNHTHQEHVLVSYLEPEKKGLAHFSFVDDDTFPQQKFSLTVPHSELVSHFKQPIVLGSSHGLFCLRFVCKDPSGRFKRKVVIWNPSVRKSVVIPDFNVSDGWGWNSVVSFGVCLQTKDIKVVQINKRNRTSVEDESSNDDTPYQVGVYTLSSGTWRVIPTINHFLNSAELLLMPFVKDEFIYWLADSDRHIANNSKWCDMIVSFDLTSEKFKKIPLPDTIAGNETLCISKLKNSLVVLEVVIEDEKEVYGVWMMEHGVSNRFTKLFNINSPDASVHPVLGFRKNAEPLFYFSKLTDDGEDIIDEGVLVQDLHSEHISYVVISGKGREFSASSYMETLLLLDH